jgi:hypothetical protein
MEESLWRPQRPPKSASPMSIVITPFSSLSVEVEHQHCMPEVDQPILAGSVLLLGLIWVNGGFLNKFRIDVQVL